MGEHVHTYIFRKVGALVHTYNGKRQAEGPSAATDILHQWVCSDKKCGKTITFDLTRKR